MNNKQEQGINKVYTRIRDLVTWELNRIQTTKHISGSSSQLVEPEVLGVTTVARSRTALWRQQQSEQQQVISASREDPLSSSNRQQQDSQSQQQAETNPP